MAEYDVARILAGLDDVFEVSSSFFMPGELPDERIHFARILDIILETTDSRFGFLARVRHSSGSRLMHTVAISNIAWDDTTRQLYAEHAAGGHDFHFDKLDSLYGWVLRNEKPLITNEPTDDPRAGGFPEGHEKFHSFCCLPVRVGDRMVGLLGLANRTEGFTGQEPDYLRPFLHQVGLSMQIFSYFSLAERTIASSAGREAILSQQNNWYGHREVWSSLAHALNGIFATVSLQTQMLRTGIDSPDSVARGLDRMEAALASVSHYSDQLSLLGRMQSARISRANIDEILRTVEFLLGDSVETANRLIVINSLPEDSSVDLLPRELLSLLYAVVINAIEATEGTAEQIVIEATGNHTEAVIAVSDHGPGVPASVAALVSHRRASSKSPSRGTGLLAVRTLAEGIGGRLDIDSGPRGTTVIVRLPLLAPE